MINRVGLALTISMALPGQQTFAFEQLDQRDSVFVFGGAMLADHLSFRTLIPFATDPEDNYIAGVAYERHLYDLMAGFDLGFEIGVAGRFGDDSSLEGWLGPSIRHQGISIGSLTVSPGIVVGVSAVSDSIGMERVRESANGGDATLLFYLGPEIAFKFEQLPNFEFVYRVHHRSGIDGTLGDMGEGHNANIFGVRRRF